MFVQLQPWNMCCGQLGLDVYVSSDLIYVAKTTEKIKQELQS